MITVVGFLESLTSIFIIIILFVIGLILRFRYYISYSDRNLNRDATFAKWGGYSCFCLSLIVLITHFIIA